MGSGGASKSFPFTFGSMMPILNRRPFYRLLFQLLGSLSGYCRLFIRKLAAMQRVQRLCQEPARLLTLMH